MKIIYLLFLGITILVSYGCSNNTAATEQSTPSQNATALPSSTPARPVELQVIPRKLRHGMRAMMVGVGFEQGEPVAFYLIRPDGTKTSEGESTADTTGGVAYQLDVMDDWQPGQYIAHVQSRKNPLRRAEQKIELQRR